MVVGPKYVVDLTVVEGGGLGSVAADVVLALFGIAVVDVDYVPP